MSQQYTSPQANERVTTGETYEMSQPQNANSPQLTNRSQASTLDAGPAGANDRALGQSAGTQAQSAGTQTQSAGTQTQSAGTQTGNGSLLRDPEDLRRRWESVQVGFVDNPREAVGEAENLVSSAIGEIAGQFRQQRERLEASWDQGRDPSTDDLRLVFQGYRDFFGRLLQV
jgi:hypothetical protein